MNMCQKQEQREIFKKQPMKTLISQTEATNAPPSARLKRDSTTEKENGIPPSVRAKYENNTKLSFHDVLVHYNSDKPAQIQALAYTLGNQVYIGPGQEKYLEHELGHVVQQKQGRVKATGNLKGIPVNDDVGLEDEADNVMLKMLNGAESNSKPVLQAKWVKSVFSTEETPRPETTEETPEPETTEEEQEKQKLKEGVYEDENKVFIIRNGEQHLYINGVEVNHDDESIDNFKQELININRDTTEPEKLGDIVNQFESFIKDSSNSNQDNQIREMDSFIEELNVELQIIKDGLGISQIQGDGEILYKEQDKMQKVKENNEKYKNFTSKLMKHYYVIFKVDDDWKKIEELNARLKEPAQGKEKDLITSEIKRIFNIYDKKKKDIHNIVDLAMLPIFELLQNGNSNPIKLPNEDLANEYEQLIEIARSNIGLESLLKDEIDEKRIQLLNSIYEKNNGISKSILSPQEVEDDLFEDFQEDEFLKGEKETKKNELFDENFMNEILSKKKEDLMGNQNSIRDKLRIQEIMVLPDNMPLAGIFPESESITFEGTECGNSQEERENRFKTLVEKAGELILKYHLHSGEKGYIKPDTGCVCIMYYKEGRLKDGKATYIPVFGASGYHNMSKNEKYGFELMGIPEGIYNEREQAHGVSANENMEHAETSEPVEAAKALKDYLDICQRTGIKPPNIQAQLSYLQLIGEAANIGKIEQWNPVNCAEPAIVMALHQLQPEVKELVLSVPFESYLSDKANTVAGSDQMATAKHTCARCAISEHAFASVVGAREEEHQGEANHAELVHQTGNSEVAIGKEPVYAESRFENERRKKYNMKNQSGKDGLNDQNLLKLGQENAYGSSFQEMIRQLNFQITANIYHKKPIDSEN